MSVRVEYFFNYPKTWADLAQEVNACLGCSLASHEGRTDDFFDRFLSMEFSLHLAVGFVNDRDLEFEQYAYYLDFRVPAGELDGLTIQIPAMLTVVYALYRSLGITGMLVYDTQRLLARYEERQFPDGRCLYDSVSVTVFLEFSNHLRQIEQRLPEDRREPQ